MSILSWGGYFTTTRSQPLNHPTNHTYDDQLGHYSQSIECRNNLPVNEACSDYGALIPRGSNGNIA